MIRTTVYQRLPFPGIKQAIQHKSNYFCTQAFDHLIFHFHAIFPVIMPNDISANPGQCIAAKLWIQTLIIRRMLPSFGGTVFLPSGNEKEIISLLYTGMQMSIFWCNGKDFRWDLVFLAQGSGVRNDACLLDLSWPWIWSSSVYGTCLTHKEMVYAMGGRIKLLVMLHPVLFINCSIKHKVKLKLKLKQRACV